MLKETPVALKTIAPIATVSINTTPTIHAIFISPSFMVSWFLMSFKLVNNPVIAAPIIITIIIGIKLSLKNRLIGVLKLCALATEGMLKTTANATNLLKFCIKFVFFIIYYL